MPFQLHNGPLVAPGVEGFSANEPCHGEAVSGDALFVETGRSDGAVMLLLVDVMGHGPAAAAVVAAIETRYLTKAKYQDRRPADLLAALDAAVEHHWETAGLFVTAQALLLDGRVKAVCGANAALPDPFIGRPGGTWQAWGLPPGPLLGISAAGGAAAFQEVNVALPPDHVLVALTDGVTEAGRRGPGQFQHGQLSHFMNGLPPGADPRRVVLDLFAALRAHVGSSAAWPEDDTTAVALRTT
jgi:serine phosphatase RsbU (regulator of sigma subunit)